MEADNNVNGFYADEPMLPNLDLATSVHSTLGHYADGDGKSESFLQKFRLPIFREKFFHTVWICLAFMMLGWVEGLFGPTFPDLRLIINEDLGTASWLFTATPAGFLLGTVLTGILYSRFNKLLLMTVSIVGAAAATTAVPWCEQFYLMLVVKFVYGVLSASLDTGGNSEVVQTWGTEVGTYMQALHFCFALGGMISPLVAEPFLVDREVWRINSTTDIMNDTSIVQNIQNINNVSIASFTAHKESSTPVGKFTHLYSRDTNVQYAYLITGILATLTALPFIFTYFLKNSAKEQQSGEINKEPTNFKDTPIWSKCVILALLSLLMLVYCGTEDTYAGFLMTFCISQLGWSKSSGSLATSVHWVCFGFTRLCAIYFVRFLNTSTLLYIFSIFMIISFTCFLISTVFNIIPLIWIFIGLSGLSMSVIFPAIFTLTNERIVTVSGRISAMFLTSASLGVMLFPLLFGYMMKRFSSMWFIYLLLGQSVLWVVMYTVLIMITRCMLNPRNEEVVVRVEELNVLPQKNKDDGLP